jgi:hypothetical protein
MLFRLFQLLSILCVLLGNPDCFASGSFSSLSKSETSKKTDEEEIERIHNKLTKIDAIGIGSELKSILTAKTGKIDNLEALKNT